MNYQEADYSEENRSDGPDQEQYRQGSIPQIFQLVERLARKLRNIQRQSVSDSGLTPPQYVVLSALAERDCRPFKELAETAHCTRATITGIVDVLERRCLVTRLPNPDDRRSLLAALTEKGKKLQRATPTMEKILHGCCTGLQPKQALQLTRLLSQLDKSLISWEDAP